MAQQGDRAGAARLYEQHGHLSEAVEALMAEAAAAGRLSKECWYVLLRCIQRQNDGAALSRLKKQLEDWRHADDPLRAYCLGHTLLVEASLLAKRTGNDEDKATHEREAAQVGGCAGCCALQSYFSIILLVAVQY